jgi:transcriptional regulator with XRE-family HTH domain
LVSLLAGSGQTARQEEWLVAAQTPVVRETIAVNLRCARERAGLSQLELADHSGVAPRTISRIESAESDTVMPKLYALAIVLSIPLADLLAGLPEP